MKKMIKRNSTHYFACSKQASIDLFGDNDQNVIMIENGISLDRFKQKKYSKERYKEKLGVPTDCFAIGHVGAFRAEKNHELLVKVFHGVLQKREDSFLILVGTGEKVENVKKIVSELRIEHRVKFLGIREDTESIYHALDCFVFPSLFEGLGMAVIEAQASGVKCIVSDKLPREVDVTGNVEFVSLDEEITLWEEKILETLNFQAIDKKNNNEIGKYDINKVTKKIERYYEGR